MYVFLQSIGYRVWEICLDVAFNAASERITLIQVKFHDSNNKARNALFSPLAGWVWASWTFGYGSRDLVHPWEIPWAQRSCENQTLWDVSARVRELCLVGWRDHIHYVFLVPVHPEQDACQQGTITLWWSWESAQASSCSRLNLL
jgi:hypothetical protein